MVRPGVFTHEMVFWALGVHLAGLNGDKYSVGSG